MSDGEIKFIYEMLNELKRTFPDAVANHNETVEMVKGTLANRNQILELIDSNWGEIPQVQAFLKMTNEKLPMLDQGMMDRLDSMTKFLTVWDQFLTATTFSQEKRS